MPTEGREHWSIGAIGLSLILTLPLATLTVRFFATYSNNVAATADCEPLTQAMERQDENQSFEERSVLLLGRRTLDQWQGSAHWHNQKPLIVRYSTLFTAEALGSCFQRAIAHYRPTTTLLILEPTDITDHGIETLAAIQELMVQRDYWATSPRLIVILPFRGPRFKDDLQLWQDYETALRKMIEFRGFSLIDPNGALIDSTGNANPNWFWPDGTTPTRDGFGRAFSVLQQSIGLGGLET
jgi:hypothetical protein